MFDYQQKTYKKFIMSLDYMEMALSGFGEILQDASSCALRVETSELENIDSDQIAGCLQKSSKLISKFTEMLKTEIKQQILLIEESDRKEKEAKKEALSEANWAIKSYGLGFCRKCGKLFESEESNVPLADREIYCKNCIDLMEKKEQKNKK